MNGNVHFHSRPVTMSRLCFYFSLIIVGSVLLLPRPSTGVYKAGSPSRLDGLEMVASHPSRPSNQLLEESSTRDMTPLENVTSQKPAMRVKTGYHAIIQQAGQRHGVEAALIQAIIMAESSYNPHAVSHRGAAGLMQLMPATADSMGVKDRFDPKHNIDGGVRYFKRMLVRFDGDKRLALAAYNAGARKVRQYNGIPPYKATRSYITRVFQYYQTYKDLANPSNKV